MDREKLQIIVELTIQRPVVLYGKVWAQALARASGILRQNRPANKSNIDT